MLLIFVKIINNKNDDILMMQYYIVRDVAFSLAVLPPRPFSRVTDPLWTGSGQKYAWENVRLAVVARKTSVSM